MSEEMADRLVSLIETARKIISFSIEYASNLETENIELNKRIKELEGQIYYENCGQKLDWGD